NQYWVDVNVTDMGTANTVDIEEGSLIYATANGVGTYTVGPFTNGSTHQLILAPDDGFDGYCSLTSDPLTYNCPVLANDNCDGASTLPVNPDTAWTSFVHDSTTGAVAS